MPFWRYNDNVKKDKEAKAPPEAAHPAHELEWSVVDRVAPKGIKQLLVLAVFAP